jgi:hypothetical protein
MLGLYSISLEIVNYLKKSWGSYFVKRLASRAEDELHFELSLQVAFILASRNKFRLKIIHSLSPQCRITIITGNRILVNLEDHNHCYYVQIILFAEFPPIFTR